MKFVLVLAALAACAFARDVPQNVPWYNTIYNYMERFGIPRGEEIQKFEEEYLNNPSSRIIGGQPATPGQVPYQAGLISEIRGITGRGVCGGSLIAPNRVLSVAHCWFDGRHQAWKLTIVLGSVFLFHGGTRVETSAVAMHPNYSPLFIRNDIMVVYMPTPVATSPLIRVIALPSGPELHEDFAGESAIASGFGITSDDGGISPDQSLNHVRLNVISNNVCSIFFPLNLQDSNICTSGFGGTSTCRGDSGGPLAITRNDREIVIGATSFGSALGCEVGFPAVYTRVTSHIPFIKSHL